MDIMKFVFACLIVLIHLSGSMSRPSWFTYNYTSLADVIKTIVICPIMRIAVPFFFIATAYFLFRKAERTDNKKDVIVKYVKRSLILYGIWFLLNIVYVVRVRHLYFFVPGHQTIGSFLQFLHELFFSSTFGASWFLMACVLDAVILGGVIYGIKSEKLAWLISIAGFVLCCLTTNYRPLLEGNIIGELLLKFDSHIIGFKHSFVYGLIYFMIGRAIVKNEARLKDISIKKLCAAAAAAYLLMLAELVFLDKVIGSEVIENSLIMLPAVAAALVVICTKCEMEYKPWYSFLRNASIIMYCSHRSVYMCLKIINDKYVYINSFAAYVLCLAICTGIAWVIISLSRRYKVFKYLY